jgi:hypothetical protein
MTEYKPLTPSFRQEINADFDERISELQECKPTALVNMQIEALKMYQRLIKGLPDGYPMPLAERKEKHI